MLKGYHILFEGKCLVLLLPIRDTTNKETQPGSFEVFIPTSCLSLERCSVNREQNYLWDRSMKECLELTAPKQNTLRSETRKKFIVKDWSLMASLSYDTVFRKLSSSDVCSTRFFSALELYIIAPRQKTGTLLKDLFYQEKFIHLSIIQLNIFITQSFFSQSKQGMDSLCEVIAWSIDLYLAFVIVLKSLWYTQGWGWDFFFALVPMPPPMLPGHRLFCGIIF